MALTDLLKPKTINVQGGGLRGLLKQNSVTQKDDLTTLEGLEQTAQRAGLGERAEKITDETSKLSFLQRLGKGLGAFNPAEAILTGTEKGLGFGVGKFVTGVGTGIASAITGRDIEGERRTFSDVAEKLGVENRIAKFGIGFLGDVLLDPSTYFGGAIARGIGVVVKGTAKTALSTVGKVAPEVETGLKIAGTGLQDALGRAFAFGYKSSKGAKEDVLTFLSKEQQAKLGLASSNLERLGTGVLTNSQREELALKMIAGKRAEFTARQAKGAIKVIKEGAPKTDEEIIKAIDTLMGKATEARVGVDVVEKQNFMLSIKSKLSKGEKLTGGEKSAINEIIAKTRAELSPSITAAEKARIVAQSSDPTVQKAIEMQITRSKKFAEGITENPYETYFPFIKKDKLQKFLNETSGLRVGSEGYRKQFKNLLTNENLELDPAKAFFTRESQVVTDRMTRDFLSSFVKKHGKGLDDFRNVDDALKEGFVLIKEKGSFGKELGYVSKFDGALIRDAITPEFQSINMLAKATGFDAITSLFKRSVTGLFAPFHVRNFVSGNIQNFEVLGKDVFNPKNIAAGQKIALIMAKNGKIPAGTINVGGKAMKFKDVMKPFIDRFSGDTFYNADFDFALKNAGELKRVGKIFSKTRVKETAKTLGLGQEAIPFKIGRTVGQYIEHQQKATAYITALGQGKKIDDALKIAEQAGFDYRALTRFESQIMRRLIPFYSFTRKNIELQLKTLGENPQRINQVLSFFRNLGEPISEEEKKNLPDFLKESIGVKLQDTPEGLKQYISSFGTPIEAFTQLFGENPILRTLSTFNPVLKVPVELGIGKDSFRQRDLKDVYTANEYKLAPQIIKDLLLIEEVKKPVFKTINGKAVKVGEKIAFVADPERLLVARSLFTSRGVSYLDQLFGNDLKGFVKLLKTTTGIKPQQIDIEAQKFFSERDKKRALEDLLERHGVIRRFTKTFAPKE